MKRFNIFLYIAETEKCLLKNLDPYHPGGQENTRPPMRYLGDIWEISGVSRPKVFKNFLLSYSRYPSISPGTPDYSSFSLNDNQSRIALQSQILIQLIIRTFMCSNSQNISNMSRLPPCLICFLMTLTFSLLLALHSLSGISIP